MNRPGPIPEWVDLDQLAALDPEDNSWRDAARCDDTPMSVFFPTPERGTGYAFDFSEAAETCHRCPVKLRCLASWLPTISLTSDADSGCYVGGCTPRERYSIRKALEAA